MTSTTKLSILLLIMTSAALFMLKTPAIQSQTENIPAKKLREETTPESFEEFEEEFHKKYSNVEEEALREQIYEENLEFIDKVNNNNNGTFTLDINKFSDLTEEEFQQKYTGLKLDENETEIYDEEDIKLLSQSEIKQSVDYRYLDLGIKDQGGCGSCWAFSAIGVTEMLYERKYNFRLSEQDLVNCEKKSDGCQGASQLSHAMEFIMVNGFLDEVDVPYKKIAQVCDLKTHMRQKLPTGTLISSYFSKTPNCDHLKQYLSNYGPVNAAIHADTYVKDYKGGILSNQWGEQDQGQPNHAVIVVGYTPDEWIIKNSWGTDYGENGYLRIKMGNQFNICTHFSAFLGTGKRITTTSTAYNQHVKTEMNFLFNEYKSCWKFDSTIASQMEKQARIQFPQLDITVYPYRQRSYCDSYKVLLRFSQNCLTDVEILVCHKSA